MKDNFPARVGENKKILIYPWELTQSSFPTNTFFTYFFLILYVNCKIFFIVLEKSMLNEETFLRFFELFYYISFLHS
jgi:hypothetical protein